MKEDCVEVFDQKGTSNEAFWRNVYKQKYSTLRETELGDLVDADFNKLLSTRNKQVVKIMIDNPKKEFVNKVFDMIIESNFIKSKINPSLLIKKISGSELRDKLDHLLPFMNNQRHWFVVVKYIMKRGYVPEGDFRTASRLIKDAYDGIPPFGIVYEDLSRMNVERFSKDIDCWYDSDNPAKTARDKQFCEIINACQRVFS